MIRHDFRNFSKINLDKHEKAFRKFYFFIWNCKLHHFRSYRIILHKQSLHISLCCNIMSNAKRSEILLKVIKPIYEQHLDMRDIIDSLLVYVCREENSLQKRYFCFLLLVFIIMTVIKNWDNRIFFVSRKQCIEISEVVLKWRKILKYI